MALTRLVAFALMGAYVLLFVPPFRYAPALFPEVPAFPLIAAGSLLKALPVLLLASRAYSASSNKALGRGLMLAGFGDVFLDLQEARKEPFFTIGLGFFLFAHILYTVWFFQFEKARSILSSFAFTMLPIIMLRVLYAGLPSDLILPVVIYALAISVMGHTAIRALAPAPVSRLMIAGALLFILSDSILAINDFGPQALRTPAYAKLLVMLTYYGAQATLGAAADVLAAGPKKRA